MFLVTLKIEGLKVDVYMFDITAVGKIKLGQNRFIKIFLKTNYVWNLINN